MKTRKSPPEQRYNNQGGKHIPALFFNIIGTLILLMIIAAFFPLTVPRVMGYQIYHVVSGSMTPAIPKNSVVYVKDVEPETVEDGDVIAFQREESVITHRVLENRFVVGEFVTKGDANTAEDLNPVPYDAYIGKVTLHIPALGGIMALLSSDVGKIYMLLLLASGAMLNILAARMREHQKLLLKQEEDEDDGDFPEEKIRKSTKRNAGRRKKKKRQYHRKARRVLLVVLAGAFLCFAGSAGWILHQYQKGDELYEDYSSRYTVPESTEVIPEEWAAEEPDAGTDEPEPTDTGSQKTGEEKDLPIRVDFDRLCSENSDVVGWIYCKDTRINYPVVQAENNDYYLYRGIDRNYSQFGSIFVEAGNRRDFADASTIIYGHHMRNGSMFAGLDLWNNQKYYDQHPHMWLLTPTQDYRVDILSAYTTSAYSDTYQIFREPGPEFTAYLKAAISRSGFRSRATIQENGHYVLLSTCAYVFDEARYVVLGLLTPVNTAGGVPIS